MAESAASGPASGVFIGLVGLVFALPWAWGLTVPLAQAGFGVAVGVLALLQATVAATPADPAAAGDSALRRAVRTCGLLWIGWSAVQLLPLPSRWLAAVSPAAAALHEEVARETGAGAWNSLAIAPGKAVDALLLTLSYAVFYSLIRRSCASAPRRTAVLAAVLVAGCLQALYAIWTVSAAGDAGSASGSFVNRDHFAAYLELGLAAGTGLMLAAAQPLGPGLLRRLPAIVTSSGLLLRTALLAMVVALVLSHSRMGNAAFASALALCAGLYLVWHPQHRRFGLLLFVSIAVVDVLLVSDRFGLATVVDRLQGTRLDQEARTLVWQQLLPAIARYGFTGAGAGGFEPAFAALRPAGLAGYFDHAHNDYAELLIDAGLPGVCLLGGFVGLHLLHLLRVLRGRRDPIASGAAFAVLLGLVALGIHAAADFVLQIPAIAASLLALLAVGINLHESDREPGPAPVAYSERA